MTDLETIEEELAEVVAELLEENGVAGATTGSIRVEVERYEFDIEDIAEGPDGSLIPIQATLIREGLAGCDVSVWLQGRTSIVPYETSYHIAEIAVALPNGITLSKRYGRCWFIGESTRLHLLTVLKIVEEGAPDVFLHLKDLYSKFSNH